MRSGETPTGSRRTRWASAVFVFVVLGAALVLLAYELREYHYAQVAAALRRMARDDIAAALALTALAYAILPLYDALAVIYAGKKLPFSRIAFSSGIAYGLSQTLGLPLVTSSAIRYRFWSAWGLSTDAIARAVSFVGATFTLGIVALSGLALLLEPTSTLAVVHLPASLGRGAGGAMLLAVAGYLGWSVRRPNPIRIRGWEFPVPTPRLAVAQVVVAIADWIVAGAVLYVLLPRSAAVGFLAFLGIFALAQLVGFLSHVPGGLGVFESVMLVLMRPHLAPDATLAVLLAYRAVYYLVPFLLALVALALYELRGTRTVIATAATSTATFVTRWTPAILPEILSVTTFIGGALLLLSGATPSAPGRMRALGAVLPLGVIELSHFVGSVAGAGLIVLAWAVRRRIDAAYVLTVVLLGVGVVASLLKGLDYEEAFVLMGLLLLVAPSHHAFYRKAALTTEPLSPEWIVTIGLLIAAIAWFGIFSFRHVEYDADLWWRFTWHGDAPRSLRATAGAVGALFIFALMRLLRHPRAKPPLPSTEDLDRAREIALQSHETWPSLALLGDKALLFNERKNAFLMYGVEGRSWVALGDPIGPPHEQRELAWRLREEADRHGGWTVFYQVGAESLPLFIDLGLTLLKIGEEAVVDLDAFSLEGSSRKRLRNTRNDVGKRGGACVEVLMPEHTAPYMSTLRRISDEWLESKAAREKGFSLGFFDERYLSNFPLVLVRVNAQIVAFANLWVGADRAEVSVDLMRYTPAAPQGVMEFMFIEMLLWAKSEGYHRFNLGMAPLSGLEARTLAPLWSRAGAFLYGHGEHFYNFKGLRLYKNKFDPVWEPRYLASPGGLILPRVLANVASLISGGLRGVLAK